MVFLRPSYLLTIFFEWQVDFQGHLSWQQVRYGYSLYAKVNIPCPFHQVCSGVSKQDPISLEELHTQGFSGELSDR